VKTTRRPPSTRPYPRPVDAPLDDRERALLERAVVLGRQGWGRVHPNPLVGCVIARDGEVLGEGWHEEYGGPHAEVQALNRAGEAARGATVYVSLEPCRHQGKTPPCTDALMRAGVRRVVYGAADPGADSGGGAEALRAAGLEVIGPTMSERQAIHENPAFMHNAR
jgi:diaminohydroxyphosphoribosylaminopyrimidine deaminase/5-amino-6-(5-phosphoribosylamino)uracil reductase